MKKNKDRKSFRDDPFQHSLNNDPGEEGDAALWQQWLSIDNDTPVPGEYTAKMKECIDRETKSVRSVPYLKWAAAAACILLIAAAWNLSLQKNKTSGAGKDEPMQYARQELLENNTTKIMSYLLPDSSVVNMYPSAQIRFHKDFSSEDKREIYLKGQAVFDVRPDKKPFLVRSGALTTTVLGTVFEVKETQRDISVKLLKGKVVVKAAEALSGWDKDIYLLPGEQILYDPYKGACVKSNFDRSDNKETRPAYGRIRSDTATAEFDNEPLSNVFKQLEKKYQRRILFEKQEMTDQYFTGVVFPERDSLETILSIIARMKGLKLSDSEGVFHIHK